MYKNIELSASLMCANWLSLKDQILSLEENDIDYMHYDIADGIYAPDFTMGSSIINTVKENTKLPGHYHLMVEEPMRLFENFDLSKNEIFTIHQETSKCILILQVVAYMLALEYMIQCNLFLRM